MRSLMLTVLSFATLTFTLANATRADLKPGLLGEYFQAKGLKDDRMPDKAKPFFVRVDKQVNFAEASSDFYGSKLADGFYVRWIGVIRITKAGEYTFATTSDDGSRLYIDGRKVVENWGPHSMTRKEGKVTLTEGDHEFMITFQEGGGGAGCIATWRTPAPGSKEQPIPANVLFHDDTLAKAATAAWDKKKWEQVKGPSKGSVRKKSGVAYTRNMGPTVGTAVRIGNDANNVAFRGIIIPLDDEATTGVVFDTDTMRMAGGWTNGGLTLDGLPFTGGHGAFPSLSNDTLFTNRAAPGWADAKGELTDPRQGDVPRLGNLPKDWAHYVGLYMHGNHVVLKYTVGNTDVLETPSLVASGESPVIIRTFQLSSRAHKLTLAVADASKDKVTIQGDAALIERDRSKLLITSNTMPSGATFDVVDDSLVLHIPAGTTAMKFDLLHTNVPAKADVEAINAAKRASARIQIFFDVLTKPSKPRFPKTFTTEAQLASDQDEAKNAYVVDRLTVPYKNEYEPRMRIGGMDFFADGKRAAVSTWDGDVWIVSGIASGKDLKELTWKRFATGLHEPLGLKIVDDVIYAVDDARITRFHDTNNDGEADFYENFNSDWELTSGFHAFCFDLHTDTLGNFYFAFGSPVRPGGGSFERMSEHHGSIIRVSKDGSKLERYATGLRAPNGMGVGPDGQVTSGDNEGTFVPRCPINWISEGEFLGVVDSAATEIRNKLNTTATVGARVPEGKKRTLDASEMPKPLAWLPKNIDNSGGGQVWVTSDKWGPFNGELLHMSYGQSSLYLVLKERKAANSGAIGVNGEMKSDPLMQGGVVKFPVRFTSSAMRARFSPLDGQLYVAGLKGWQSNAGKEGGLDRVRYTGNTVLMPTALKTTKTGLEITFSQKLDPELANDPDSFSVRGSDIRWTHGYGTREYKLGQRNSSTSEQGWTTLKVKSSKLLADGKTVAIEVENMQPAHEMEINIDLETTDGDVIRAKINNTVHVVE